MSKTFTQYPEYTDNPFPYPELSPKNYVIVMDNTTPITYMSAYKLVGMLKTDKIMGLLFHLCGEPVGDDNEVLIPMEIYQAVTGTKGRATYYRTLSEMLEKGVIARKKYHNNVFYMNPEYIRKYSPVK